MLSCGAAPTTAGIATGGSRPKLVKISHTGSRRFAGQAFASMLENVLGCCLHIIRKTVFFESILPLSALEHMPYSTDDNLHDIVHVPSPGRCREFIHPQPFDAPFVFSKCMSIARLEQPGQFLRYKVPPDVQLTQQRYDVGLEVYWGTVERKDWLSPCKNWT